MQPAECVQRGHPAFNNHTPRDFEMTAARSTSSSRTVSEMLADPPMGSRPRSPTAIMPPSPWLVEKHESDRSMVEQGSIRVEEADSGAEPFSRPDSWSIHYACTDQAPYNTDQLTAEVDGNMMTTTSLLKLPRDNDSRNLAFFLRTTGPDLSHRRPTKIEQTKPPVTAPIKAWWFFKIGSKRSAPTPKKTRESLKLILRDEGGLLSDDQIPTATVPMGAEQKFSSTGKRYLALQIPTAKDDSVECPVAAEEVCNVSPLLEPRVSLPVVQDVYSTEDLDSWLHVLSQENLNKEVHGKMSLPTQLSEGSTLRTVQHSSSPVRAAASSAPSPANASEASGAASFDFDLELESSLRQSYDATCALSSHPVVLLPPRFARAPIALPNEAFPVRYPGEGKSIDIKSPCPRRMGSHPLLHNRASSFASSLYPPNPSESPGPPPPRSPLRLRRDSRTIENVMAIQGSDRAPAPKVAPPILPGSGRRSNKSTIKSTVVTNCSGPISRKNITDNGKAAANRKDRNEKIRAKKLRDKPSVTRMNDVAAGSLTVSARQRLKKARPQVQMSQLRPAPLVTRGSSSSLTSSFTTAKRNMQLIHPPISPVPSEDDEGWIVDRYTTPVSPVPPRNSGYGKTGSTPTPLGRNAPQDSMALSPVMLVAEQVPLLNCETPPIRAAKLVVRDGKGYAPRPRSASMSRTALKRRSRAEQPTPRPVTPTSPECKAISSTSEPPPLPSPPPNRALPPTPPFSEISKPMRTKIHAATTAAIAAVAIAEAEDKCLPDLPIAANSKATRKTSIRHAEHTPHILTQQKPPPVQMLRTPSVVEYQPHPASTPDCGSSSRTSRFDARLEALEKQNALLSAALMAVLKTNGALNGPPSAEDLVPLRPAQWESRVARKTTAVARTHGTPSSVGSNGSALEMYMSTRREG